MNYAISLIRHIPILGWLISDAQKGNDTSKILFFANLAMLWILSIYVFGYAAFIITTLALVPIMFLALISVTAEDGF